MKSTRSLLGRAAGAVLTMTVLAACGGGSSTAAAPSTTAEPAAGTSSTPAGPAVPAGTLITEGELSFCTDPTAPPLEFLDENQKLVGAEVELGENLATRLGLKPVWKPVAFSGIIPALQSKQCDVILAQLFIKPEREKVVDFVPYLYSSNTMLIKAGSGITGIDGLCGKKAAAGTGTTASEYLKTANAKCSGSKIDVRLFTKDSDALQQLKIGLVDAYGTTVETAGYVMKQDPGKFEMAGEPFGQITCGMAVRKDAAGLKDALSAAFQAARADGSYDKILGTWNLTADALKS